jgi:3-deoxy-manno-octulosonate cytidylyltransferase (CMP-KDO synthetase)
MNNTMKTSLTIPVRLDSTRLPNKALKDINGISLIQRVVNQCEQTNLTTYLITDSEKIANSIKTNKTYILYDKTKAESGTERISNAINFISEDNIINVQGDQPFISPKAILELAEYMIKYPQYNIVTPIKEHKKNYYKDTSKCKVVVNINGKAIYFSRNSIPYNSNTYWGHLGMYGYKKDILKDYKKLKPSPLEKIEKLEQLKFIDNDIHIQTYKTDHSIFSVDTEIDLINAIEYARKIS